MFPLQNLACKELMCPLKHMEYFMTYLYITNNSQTTKFPYLVECMEVSFALLLVHHTGLEKTREKS